MKAIRARVSGSRVRFMKEGFDLDLTYITPTLIAMGYPATGMEKTYRNDISEVADFLQRRHAGAYRVYNLSERKYDYSKFENRVNECGFPDHHPPPLQLLLDIMNDMLAWTSRSTDNVVVVHCLAGKGRTGVVCSCFLLLTGFYGNLFAVTSDRELRQMANHAIRDFWDARGQGVRYPSQALYIYYFARVIRRLRSMPREIPRLRPAKKMLLKCVVLNGIPDYDAPPRGGCTPFLQVLPAPSLHDKPALLYNSSWQNPNFETYAPDPSGSILFETNCVIQGDILIRGFHANSFSMLGRHVVQMFHVTFNTDFFRKDCDLLRLRKKEVDEAHDNARFPESFCLDCHVERIIDDDEFEFGNEAEMDLIETSQEQQLDEDELASDAATVRVSDARSSTAQRDSLGVNGSGRRPSLQREPSMQPNPAATMMGWLYKQGGFVRSWKKRWFVARDGQLTYYQSASDPTPLGVVDLHGVLVDTAYAEETTARNKHLNYFKIVPRKKEERTWFFGADSEKDMAKWIRALSTQSCHGMVVPATAPTSAPLSLSELGRAVPLASQPLRRASMTYRKSEFALPHGENRSSTFNEQPQRLSDSRVVLGSKRGGAASMIDFTASTSSNTAERGSFGNHAGITRTPPRNMKTHQVARVNSNESDAFSTQSLDTSKFTMEHAWPLRMDEDFDDDDDDAFDLDAKFLVSGTVPTYAKSKPLATGPVLSERDRQTVLEQVTDDFKIGMYIYTADELQAATNAQHYVNTVTMLSPFRRSGERISIAQCVQEAIANRDFEFAEQVMTEIVLTKFPILVDAMECNPAFFIDSICSPTAIEAGGATASSTSTKSLPRRSRLAETEF